MLYVVVSVWHAEGRDRTFLHGVFDDYEVATKIKQDVRMDLEYVEREGYDISHGEYHSVSILEMPFDVRVNQFVPTVV